MSGFRPFGAATKTWLIGAVLSVALAAPAALGQGKKGPARPPALPTPALQRLSQMTPQQRQKALSRLPPERRERIEQQLNRLDQLPPDQKAKLLQRYDEFQGLPRDRQAAVRAELQALRKMPIPQRRQRLNSPEFQQSFSPEEQRLLRESLGRPAAP
jgi:hypothetical protein